MKQLLLAAIVTAIHYSALGDYLVDQDGNRTTIQEYPNMVCHQGQRDIEGRFYKAKGATIWLTIPKGAMFMPDDIQQIDKPVCDLK